LVEGCSELLDQRKQTELQRLQDPSEINIYLKDKIDELAMNSNTCIEE
jgi:hypothetical protein